MKLLFRTNIKQKELLKFEEQLLEDPEVNTPNKNNEIKPKAKQLTKSRVSLDVPEYTVINGQGGILIRVHKGNSVVTREDIADFHERPPFAINDIINDNIHKLRNDIDYFVDRDELLFSKSGYLALTESFDDKLSLKVRKEMIKSYFKKQSVTYEVDNKSNITEEKTSSVCTNDFPGGIKFVLAQLDIQNKRLIAMEKILNEKGLGNLIYN
jgi:hypothetical protein